MSKLSTLFLIIVAASVLHVGWRLIPIFYSYYELQNQFEQLVRLGEVEQDDDIKKKLNYQLKKSEVPAQLKDVRYYRSNTTMRLTLEYDQPLVLFIPWEWKEKTVHTFHFKVEAEAQYAPSGYTPAGGVVR